MRVNNVVKRYGLLVIALLLACSIACGPPASQNGAGAADPASAETPELSDEIIHRRINETRVYDVLPESGTGEPIAWSFDEDEPKEITIVEKKIDGNSAAVTLDVKTQSAPNARIHRELQGRIRTDWRLETGFVLRRWEIVNTENLSMKYRDLPKQTPTPPPLPDGATPGTLPTPDGPPKKN